MTAVSFRLLGPNAPLGGLFSDTLSLQYAYGVTEDKHAKSLYFKSK